MNKHLDIPSPDLTRTWLHDGTPVLIRPIERTDLELERTFVNGLSPQTRYLRLLSGRALLPGELERWTDIDPAREMALIAVSTIGGVERQLGVARCVRDEADPQVCDFAIVIGDPWQHHGLGRALLTQLMRSATEAGIDIFGGITLSTNHAMLTLAHRLGFRARREVGDATVTRLEVRLGEIASPMAPVSISGAHAGAMAAPARHDKRHSAR